MNLVPLFRQTLCTGLLFICTTLSAQHWSTTTHEADEMLGIDAPYTTHIFTSASGDRFTYRSDLSGQYTIWTGTSIFSCNYYDGRHGAIVKVGLYDADGHMLEMFDMFLRCSSDSQQSLSTFNLGFMSNPVGQGRKVTKIMTHLTTSTGYVRIIAPIYSHQDMDFRILCHASTVTI